MVLKFLHIAFIFGGITLVYGTEILLHRISRSGDTRAIRTAFAMAKPVATVGPVIFWIGVAFGLTAAIVNGYNLLAPWLVATYALIATILVAALRITVPWLNRVGALAASAPDGPASPELTTALHDRSVTVLLYLSLVVDVAIVALMVFKPGA